MDTFCPNGHRVEVLAADIGTQTRCPVCQRLFTVESSGAGRPVDDSLAAENRASDRMSRRWSLNVLEQMRPMAQLFLLLGLVLTLFTRGWDGVGDRRVVSMKSRVQHAVTQWNDKWQDRLDRIAEEEKSIRTKADLTAADRERLDQLRSEYQKVQADRDADRQQQASVWNDMEREARDAEAQNQMVKPWREGFFVFGTILFAVGLAAIGFTTEGPVRWFCLVLLAIIVFSIYFGADTGLKPTHGSSAIAFPQST
jgi:hypothetical protein